MMRHSLLVAVLAILSLLSACSDGERMRRELVELERWNAADSVLQNDSLARALVDYFDSHGTPDEQLRAYYLLGRTHADRGETPQALNAYYDAIDRADTTHVGCNYHKLCRIYSQMSDIFYRQNLVSNQALCLDKAISYAYLSNDTVAALTLYAHKILPYDKLGWNDSIISVCEHTYKAFCRLGYPQIGSQYYSYAVRAYTNKGDYARARHCMDIYEQESGYFDNYGNIGAGREVYYAIKGDFYQAIGKYDSAEYYYRKELTNGLDYNNQTLASKGLATLFMQTHQPDSAAFYAAYAFNMNDSNYAQMSTTDVERIQTAYNYSHQQQLAQTEKKRADRERKLVLWLAIALLLTLALGGTIVYAYKKRRKTTLKAYKEKVRELETLQTDTLYLRSHEKELDSLLAEKEIKIEQLKREIDANKDKEKIQLEARKNN